MCPRFGRLLYIIILYALVETVLYIYKVQEYNMVV